MARKHITQMTEREESYLIRKASKLDVDRLSSHVVQRMRERDISKEDIKTVMKDYRAIEYKMGEFGEQTVLIQGNKPINGNYINVILGINSSKIVTCFKNPERNKFVNMDIYNPKLDIVNLIKSDTMLNTGYFRKSGKR